MPRDTSTYDPFSKRNSLHVIVGELRAKIQGTGIVRTTFLSHEAGVDLTTEQLEKIEAALRKRLGSWYSSWIDPLLTEIEAKDPKVKAEKEKKAFEARVVKIKALLGAGAYKLPPVGLGSYSELKARVVLLHKAKVDRSEIIDYIVDTGHKSMAVQLFIGIDKEMAS